MKTLIALVVGLSVAANAEWTCSIDQVRETKEGRAPYALMTPLEESECVGNICCNAEVEAMIKGKLEKGGHPKTVAVDIRNELEKQETGYWEAYVSDGDFGFANYMVDTYHCKVQLESGTTALVWKVLKE